MQNDAQFNLFVDIRHLINGRNAQIYIGAFQNGKQTKKTTQKPFDNLISYKMLYACQSYLYTFFFRFQEKQWQRKRLNNHFRTCEKCHKQG